MIRIAQNNMVEHFNFEKLSGAYQVACHLNVGFGWRSLPARVIMRENNGVGGGHNGQPEYFAGVYQNRILRADSNQIMAFNPTAGIEHQHNEAFTLGVEMRMRGDVQTPKIGGFLWRVT